MNQQNNNSIRNIIHRIDFLDLSNSICHLFILNFNKPSYSKIHRNISTVSFILYSIESNKNRWCMTDMSIIAVESHERTNAFRIHQISQHNIRMLKKRAFTLCLFMSVVYFLQRIIWSDESLRFRQNIKSISTFTAFSNDTTWLHNWKTGTSLIRRWQISKFASFMRCS